MSEEVTEKRPEENKPIIATMINTAALALTSFGVVQITANGSWESMARGSICILMGAGLEWFKYWGMKKRLW